jgi:hypothetical protein
MSVVTQQSVLVQAADIEQARVRIAAHVHRTPSGGNLDSATLRRVLDAVD